MKWWLLVWRGSSSTAIPSTAYLYVHHCVNFIWRWRGKLNLFPADQFFQLLYLSTPRAIKSNKVYSTSFHLSGSYKYSYLLWKNHLLFSLSLPLNRNKSNWQARAFLKLFFYTVTILEYVYCTTLCAILQIYIVCVF